MGVNRKAARDDQATASAGLVDDALSALPSWQLAVIRFNDQVAASMGIAASDLQCLFVLERHGSSSPSEIARAVALTTGSTSRMIERLVQAGLVTRTHGTVDRRRIEVAMTRTARTILHRQYDPLDQRLRPLLADLGDDALRQLVHLAGAAEAQTVAAAAELSAT